MTCSTASCPRLPAPGRKLCQHHIDYQREWRVKQRARCRAHGPAGECSLCRKVRTQAQKYRANVRAANLATVCRRNGITVTRYEAMLEEQADRCAICGELESARQRYRGVDGVLKRLAIDHCHESGRVRGLLCNNCNRAIGMFRDDPAVLRSAVAYLERFSA